MEHSSSRNRTIAKNTLYLYIRTFITMLLSIYTSRVILEVIGVNDYGLYNVVGGIAASFTFLSSMLSNATQRYLNFAIGKNDAERAGQVFNMNLIIYVIYAVLSILIVELAGSWFIENKMNVSEDRVSAVYCTLHSTTVILTVSLISSVYESVLIARENMKIYAYMGLFDAIVKLAIVYVISVLSFDKLKLYAILMALMSVSTKMIPIIYTIRHYSETKICFYWNREQFKSMFGFIGWNFVGTSAFIVNDQGLNMLLNVFFGPGVNAARALAMQVKGAISNFAISFCTAIRPQIVKSYASGDIGRFKYLIYNSTKYTFFLLWIVCLPIILRVNSLMHIWLNEVPQWTCQFVVWICIFTLINNSFCDPIWQGMQAIGEIKKFVLIGSGIYLLAFPGAWIAFKYGADPLSAFQIIVCSRVIYFIVTLLIFRRFIELSIREYLMQTLYPVLKVVLLSIFFGNFINGYMGNGVWGTLISCILIALAVLILIVITGINKEERLILITTIKRKLCRV